MHTIVTTFYHTHAIYYNKLLGMWSSFSFVLTWSEYLHGVDLSTQNQNLAQLRAKQHQNLHFCMLCKFLKLCSCFLQ